jgi:Xaa-Pro dipeptidase
MYLFGVKEPDFFGALDLYTGKSFLFCPRLNPEYAVWLGKIQPPSYFKELYEVDSGHYVDEIHEVLKDSQRGGDWTLYLLHGQNTDSGNFSKPASFQVYLKLL